MHVYLCIYIYMCIAAGRDDAGLRARTVQEQLMILITLCIPISLSLYI